MFLPILFKDTQAPTHPMQRTLAAALARHRAALDVALRCMRTTLTLDDDIAARLQAESRKTGRPFKTVVNDYLRAWLAKRRADTKAAPFRVETVRMGALLPGRSYDNIGALLEDAEGDEHR